MKVNEDGTITLSQRETQKFITKVINPEYKQMERMKKFYKQATTQDITQVGHRISQVAGRLNNVIKELKAGNTYSKSGLKALERELNWLNFGLQGSVDGYPEDEANEIEKAYRLYKLLLKHRRYKEENEQT